MVEAGAREMDEETMLKAIMFGHENIKKICEFQEEFTKLIGKEKIEFTKEEPNPVVKNFIDTNGEEKIKTSCINNRKTS